MYSTGKDTKRVQLILTLSVSLLLANCARRQNTLTADDMSVLENSTFNPGEKINDDGSSDMEVASASAESSDMALARGANDSGVIGKPGGSIGSDTGVIGKPGSGTSTLPTPTSVPVVVAPSPSPEPVVVVTNPVVSGSSSSSSNSTPVDNSSSTSTVPSSSSTSSSTQVTGNDGGFIPQSGTQGGDLGSVAQTGSNSSGSTVVSSQNGTSSSSSSNPSSSTSSSSSSPVEPGTSASGSTSQNPAQSPSTSANNASSVTTQPAGSDNGVIGQGGNQSQDVGSVNSTTGSTSSGSNSTPVVVASNSGSSEVNSSSGPTNENPAVVTNPSPTGDSSVGNSSSSSSATSSSPQPGHDGGVIVQGGTQSPDVGSVSPVNSNVNPDVGSSHGTNSGGTTPNSSPVPQVGNNNPVPIVTPAPIPTVNAGGNTITDLIKQMIDKLIAVVTSIITGIDQGQVAQNGGTNPPDLGTQGASGGNSSGSTAGNSCSCSSHNNHNHEVVSIPTPKPTPIPVVVNDTSVKINVGRACSVRRSKVPAPRFVFFEESKHPILSMEAMSQNTYAECQNTIDMIANLHYDISGTYCGSQTPNTTLVTNHDISSFDMVEQKNKVNAEFSLASLKKKLGISWRSQIVAITVCDDLNKNGKCSDEKPSNILSVLPPSFALKSVPSKLEIDVWSGRNLDESHNPESCDVQYSPLLLDLTGEGFKLSGPENGVYFDLNNTGEAIATGWTDASNIGFLVRDLDKDRGISSGAELFGNATVLKNGERAANGFEALKDLDDNKDMLFDSNDSAWKGVKIWIDANSNGIAERKELSSLRDQDILSINLNYKTVFEVDQYGNATKQRSVFNKKGSLLAGPQVLQIIDVWFQTLVSH